MRQLKTEPNISCPTANKTATQLEKAGILTELTGHRQNRLFAAKQVLDLL